MCFTLNTGSNYQACFILHNYIRDEQTDRDDTFLNEVDADLAAEPLGGQENLDKEIIRNVQATNAWTSFRDDLAVAMYIDYRARRG